MKLLLYCTKAKPYLVDERKMRYHNFVLGDSSVLKSNEKDLVLNGKIVAECDFETEEIYMATNSFEAWYRTKTLNEEELREKSCLRLDELYNYLDKDNNYKGYAIHIKNLHIFDKPKELYDYGMDFPISPIVKAPQNMMYANGIGSRYILISIRPEWLCKILNGEKTIEVRKKVLKEMKECC